MHKTVTHYRSARKRSHFSQSSCSTLSVFTNPLLYRSLKASCTILNIEVEKEHEIGKSLLYRIKITQFALGLLSAQSNQNLCQTNGI